MRSILNLQNITINYDRIMFKINKLIKIKTLQKIGFKFLTVYPIHEYKYKHFLNVAFKR